MNYSVPFCVIRDLVVCDENQRAVKFRCGMSIELFTKYNSVEMSGLEGVPLFYDYGTSYTQAPRINTSRCQYLVIMTEITTKHVFTCECSISSYLS